MKYTKLGTLKDEQFRRLTGIKRTILDRTVITLQEDNQLKKKKGGRNTKLCIEDILLMTLEYLREYRTYFHISQSYGVSESTAYKSVRWVEDTLIRHSDFALPGRKELLKSHDAPA